MDNEKTYVDKVNDWLNADPTTRTIEEGATLMLQGNRNRILHKNVLQKKNFEKVVYELEKIIGGQRIVAEPVNEKVQALEANLPITMAGIESILSGESKGKRADHETLPADIRASYDKNLEIYPRMRSIQERLKVLNETGTATERLPFLTELLALDSSLRENWDNYDKFDVNAPVIVAAATKLPEGEKIDAKRVSANRKYLSDNKAKLTVLVADGKTDKATELLDKMQVRFNELILNGETFAPDQLTELKALGIIGATTEESKPEVETPVVPEGKEVILPAGEVTEETKPETVVETPVVTEGKEEILPAGEANEETPEENVIGQIKTLLNNNYAKDAILATIQSLGNFRGLELTSEVVEVLYNQALDQEMNSVE